MANNVMYYFYILGEFVTLLVAYFLRDYRLSCICVTVLASLIILYFWLVPESVRYLIGRKQYDKADAIFRRIAKSNKKVLIDDFLFEYYGYVLCLMVFQFVLCDMLVINESSVIIFNYF